MPSLMDGETTRGLRVITNGVREMRPLCGGQRQETTRVQITAVCLVHSIDALCGMNGKRACDWLAGTEMSAGVR